MADLISRYALMRDLVKRYKEFDDGKTIYHPLMTTAMQAVRNAPAVDAVEIVRCGECERRDKTADLTNTILCPWLEVEMRKTDFCSYGERRADDATD